MHKLLKQSMVLFLMVTLVIVPVGSGALAQVEFEKEKPSAGAMFADVVTLRPVGILAIGACWVLYPVVLPFAILGGNTKVATEKLIVEPWKYTVTRPIGAF